MANAANMHCMSCGMSGKPKTVTKGSIAIEIVAWFFLIIPGIIYSLWRLTTRHKACAYCGGTHLVPYNSPAAIAHRKQMGQA